jgi:hemerythrin-like domain-containing protein
LAAWIRLAQMTDTQASPIDTNDMISVHNVFRRALRDAPEQISSVKDGDTERADKVGSYLGEVLWFLHTHHNGEDELLYPLRADRAPEHAELFSRMESQHEAVAGNIESAEEASARFGESGSIDDGRALAAACSSLLDEVADHLTDEEVEVLPIAARTITPEEWGALPGHAMAQYTGTRLWLPLGLVFEAMSDDQRAHVFDNAPPPVSEMWFGMGSDAFAKEMAAIRNGAS